MYFDAYEKPEVRNECEVLVKQLEESILKISDTRIRNELTKSLFLTPWQVPSEEIQELRTNFKYLNKEFLNLYWSRYGAIHFSDFMTVLYQFHIKQLLPEVLISVAAVFESGVKQDKEFGLELYENTFIINSIITQAYADHREEIQKNDQLREAYEEILRVLIQYNFREAAVLEHEFLTH